MPGFSKQSDREEMRHQTLYGGKGQVGTRHFPFDGAPFPAHFVVYDIPPGAGEGAHVHGPADPATGFYDEYYYVVSDQGRMEIDGEVVEIGEGDLVHAPLGVRHGVENLSSDQHLKIFLTYIRRDPD